MATRTTTSLASKQSTSYQLIIAIDPSSGVSSPVGISVIDPADMSIIEATNLFTKYKKLEHRIRDLSLQIKALIDAIQAEVPEYKVLVAIETFVMVGKGGQILQNACGAIMAQIPFHYDLVQVHNTKLKSFIAAHGAADKKTMGRGLEKFFASNPASLQKIKDLTERGESDIIDSLAIGVYAWLNLKNQSSQAVINKSFSPKKSR